MTLTVSDMPRLKELCNKNSIKFEIVNNNCSRLFLFTFCQTFTQKYYKRTFSHFEIQRIKDLGLLECSLINSIINEFRLYERKNEDMPPKNINSLDLRFLIPDYSKTEIKNVIFNDPATIVLWSDGTKTVVKCQKGDTFDQEKGLAMAICKKFIGTNKSGSNFNDIFKKWIPEEKNEE